MPADEIAVSGSVVAARVSHEVDGSDRDWATACPGKVDVSTEVRTIALAVHRDHMMFTSRPCDLAERDRVVGKRPCAWLATGRSIWLLLRTQPRAQRQPRGTTIPQFIQRDA